MLMHIIWLWLMGFLVTGSLRFSLLHTCDMFAFLTYTKNSEKTEIICMPFSFQFLVYFRFRTFWKPRCSKSQMLSLSSFFRYPFTLVRLAAQSREILKAFSTLLASLPWHEKRNLTVFLVLHWLECQQILVNFLNLNSMGKILHDSRRQLRLVLFSFTRRNTSRASYFW